MNITEAEVQQVSSIVGPFFPHRTQPPPPGLAQAVRIRQVADPSVGSMSSAVKQIVSESGWGKLYEGLPSILFRQISFGMMKFLVFDFFSGMCRYTSYVLEYNIRTI